MSKVTAETLRVLLQGRKNFETCLKQLKIISASDGKCVARLKVEPEHSNEAGTLHGGLAATLVDCVSSWGLRTHGDGLRAPTVSVDMHLTFVKGAAIGEEVVIESSTVKKGKTLAFLEVVLRNDKGDVLVKGSHTKFLLSPKS